MTELTNMTDLAKQFFDIANIITGFSVIQTVGLLLSFSKDLRLVAAFLRWRPYSSVMSKHAGHGYIIAVIGCGIAEFWLRYDAGQRGAFLGACVIAVALRCAAIYLTSSVYCAVFVAICREEDWLNKNRNQVREFQTPRVLVNLSDWEKFVEKQAMKADKSLFDAPVKKVIYAENFDPENFVSEDADK